MKKLLFLAVLLTSFSNIFAFTTQGNWRWRKDDGSQTSATWLAAQNTAPIITSSSDPLRIRIELYNDSTNPGGTLGDAIFEDSTEGGQWDTIKLVPDGNDAFILAGSSPNVTDKQPTTQQLSSPHYITFQAGKVIVSSEKLPNSTVGDNSGTEYEYVIKPTANLLPSKTYYFRVDAANYPAGMPLPSLITASVLPIKLADFLVKKEGKKVKLDWSTASEQNNDRFEVEKSNDGRSWSKIVTVKGSGSSNEAHKYSSYDERPLEGLNYYRIKQYDFDSRVNVSDVKSLKFEARTNAVISVTPNPARSGINFKFENEGATNLAAVLSDANGKVIYRQTFKDVQPNAINKLNLQQQPTPGMYILQLKAEGLSESIKVVVQ